MAKAQRKGDASEHDGAGGAAPPLPAFAGIHVWQIQAVRDVLFFAAVVALVWVGYLLRTVTVPLLVALLLAYLVEPVLNVMCRHPSVSRVRAIIALVTGGGAVVLLALTIVVPLFVGQTSKLFGVVSSGVARERLATIGRFVPSDYIDEFSGILGLLPGDAEPVLGAPETVEPPPGDEATPVAPAPAPASAGLTEDDVNRLIDKRLAERSPADGAPTGIAAPAPWWRLAREGTGAVVSVLGLGLQVGLIAFLIPFYFFFFSMSYPAIIRFGRNLLPERNKARTLTLLQKMDAVVAGFVRGRIVISAIMGIMLAVGWMICDVPYAIVLGLVVGIFCAIPYLGGIGVPMAIALKIFGLLGTVPFEELPWLSILLWPTLVFAIVQVIEGYVLTPMIAGKATNLDPVTILVAVLAGGSVLGVYGMLLAIPIAACAKILFTDVLMPKIRDWTAGRASDPLPIGKS